jgi:GH24 family phage-related lysozyme (muramidase)
MVRKGYLTPVRDRFGVSNNQFTINRDLLPVSETKSQLTAEFNAAKGKKALGVAGGTSIAMAQGKAEASEDITKEFEGWRDKKYNDSKGVPTIGWGFNLNEKAVRDMLPKDVLSGKRPLKQEEAEPIFKKLKSTAENNAKDFVGVDVFNGLDAARKTVLIDMAYNLGENKLAEFDRFKKALIEKDYNKAAKEMIDSDWYSQVGNRSKKLVKMMQGEKKSTPIKKKG